MNNQLFNILVAAITLYKRSEILIIQRSFKENFMPGKWGLPCGKINFGEKLEDAVLRELREETGLSGYISKIVGYSSFTSELRNIHYHNLQINFLVDVDKKEPIVLDDSHQSYRWIKLKDHLDEYLDEFILTVIGQANLVKEL